MADLDISRTIVIDRPAGVVRRQFADVAHHQAADLHQGVTFEVIDDDGERCRYRQVSRVGPVLLTQELELPLTIDGPLVNTITRGQFAGGTITFTVEPIDAGHTSVSARLIAPLGGVQLLAMPVLRSRVGRTLARALDEDKADLEAGYYSG